MHSTEAAATGPRERQRAMPPPIAWIFLLPVVTLAVATALPPAHAQAIYRCVEKGKPVSLQTEPCSRNAKVTAIRGYVPEPAPTANDLAWKRYRTEQEMSARNSAARASGASTTTVVVPSDSTSCAQAKADRDAWERRMGLQRDIDGMRFWQDRVYQACR